MRAKPNILFLILNRRANIFAGHRSYGQVDLLNTSRSNSNYANRKSTCDIYMSLRTPPRPSPRSPPSSSPHTYHLIVLSSLRCHSLSASTVSHLRLFHISCMSPLFDFTGRPPSCIFKLQITFHLFQLELPDLICFLQVRYQYREIRHMTQVKKVN